ncbi:MAG: flavin reductase family protein [Sphingomonadaceae bacterium]|nr:flavin reductase family protein [Sphingomonadaceae bacterium]
MDEQDRKTALRMIPYGIYVMTAEAAGEGEAPAAATVNWVTQTSFAPPLVAIGVKTDSGVYAAAKNSGHFVLNVLGKGQQSAAFTFFKPAEMVDGKLSGEEISWAGNGAPILKSAAAAIECKVVEIVELGDHHTFIGEVTDVQIHSAPEGRPDEAILEMKELGEKVFYGG